MIYGYIRVSSIGQAGEDKTSLAEQTRKIEGAALAMGAALDRVYCDPGVSGGMPISQRPQGGELWGRLQPGDTLVAAKLDRLFRSLADAATTIEELARRGIDLVCVDLGFEPVGKSASGRLLLYVNAMFADYERQLIKERTWAGKGAAQAKGRHVAGSPPRGFNVVDGALVPNEEFDAMRAAYRVWLSGADLIEAVEAADDRGLLTRSGRKVKPAHLERSLRLWDKLPKFLTTG